jgi:hypothetical protein
VPRRAHLILGTGGAILGLKKLLTLVEEVGDFLASTEIYRFYGIQWDLICILMGF